MKKLHVCNYQQGHFTRRLYENFCLQNDYHNPNNYRLASTAVHKRLCRDFDHCQFLQNPCTDSHFADEENETKESNSLVHSFRYTLLPPFWRSLVIGQDFTWKF